MNNFEILFGKISSDRRIRKKWNSLNSTKIDLLRLSFHEWNFHKDFIFFVSFPPTRFCQTVFLKLFFVPQSYIKALFGESLQLFWGLVWHRSRRILSSEKTAQAIFPQPLVGGSNHAKFPVAVTYHVVKLP